MIQPPEPNHQHLTAKLRHHLARHAEQAARLQARHTETAARRDAERRARLEAAAASDTSATTGQTP